MILISNEGNLSGPHGGTGTLDGVTKALDAGFDCKITVKESSGKLLLATKEPYERLSLNFLLPNRDRLWIYCADVSTIRYFAENLRDYNFNFFSYSPKMVYTSHGNLWWWMPQSRDKINSGIVYNPEAYLPPVKIGEEALGACSDFIGAYVNEKD